MENPLKPGPVSVPRCLVEVRRVPPTSYRWVVLSTNWWKAQVHWAATLMRSLPCLQDRTRCAGHQLQLPVKELAWLHVWCLNTKQDFFLELPHKAAYELFKMLENSPPLRGTSFETSRVKGAKKGVILFEPREHWSMQTMETYPQPKDPFSTLKELWNMNEVHLKIRSSTDLETDLGAA